MEAENMSYVGNLSKNQPKEAKAQFVLKLYEIVEDESNFEYISWDSDGRSVLLKNQIKIMEKVLPKYFTLTSYHSFLRQLCFYGFKKVKLWDNFRKYDSYSHPHFRRGRKDLLDLISRKKPTRKMSGEGEQMPINSQESAKGHQEEFMLLEELGIANKLISKLRYENDALRRVLVNFEMKAKNFQNTSCPSGIDPVYGHMSNISPQYSQYNFLQAQSHQSIENINSTPLDMQNFALTDFQTSTQVPVEKYWTTNDWNEFRPIDNSYVPIENQSSEQDSSFINPENIDQNRALNELFEVREQQENADTHSHSEDWFYYLTNHM